ncbi:MAG TPA: amidohydrolase [Candidatus Bathyarchaeia archaeon]|nr:amidohydrolase [Candidatus Bathyarchaeia archaeon]
MLLTNGRIHTMGASGSVVDSLVVRDGRVAYAGRRSEVNPAPGEPVLDLGGRTVLPGLVDGHGHLMLLARARLELDLAAARSEEDAARLVAAAAARRRPGEWITGRGWDQTRWPGERFPSRASLDRAAPGHPVALVRVDGHATWASSAALARADVTRRSPDPAGGRIDRDAAGEPTGLLIDLAQDVVRALVPAPSEDRFDAAVEEAIAECLARGLTGAHEPGLDLGAVASYTRLIERGRFPFRLFGALSGKKAWAQYRERGGPVTVGEDARLTVGAIKLWLDGALGSRGAALHAPYCDDPKNTGLVLVPPEEVERLTREATARGFQVWVHAIGDRANTLALDVFEKVLGEPGPRPRLRVEHAQILAPADVPRFRRLGVVPSMQPTHCTSDMRWAGERLGAERLEGAYAWRSLLDTGTILAGGSDFPVEDANPFHGIHAAVTRRPREGDDPGWQPGQRMTRQEAVRAFTVWNARSIGREASEGSLEPGRRADLVALSGDVFSCPEARIAQLAPALSLVGGELVYDAR